MITFSFETTKNPTLQQVIQTLELAFSGLKMSTFPPNPYPTSNTQIQVHGYVGISSTPAQTIIIIGFFESPSEWSGAEITQNNVTIDFIGAVYSSIPSQTQVENVLSGAGLI